MRILSRKSNLRVLARRPGKFLCAYKWALLVLLVGATLDAVTTIKFVGHYGPEEELHPVARLFFDLFMHVLPWPIAAVAVGKLVQVLFVIFAAGIWRFWCGTILTLCGVMYFLAGCSNHFGWMVYLYKLFPSLL